MSTIAELESHAGEAAAFLRLIANERRLLVLCRLLELGESSVSDLAAQVGLSQSALSQHLAKLREDGLVGYRREAQTLHYAVRDARTIRILGLLKDMFCPDPGEANGDDR
ncbi:MAG TPA: metalloregulator ArsR/SmtB family transcription factor [Caulobacteraceae bacterium]|nr:metalloregulator ArsR/SmtB family transcription factor [Caulobacteraceae bacterium]